MVLAAVATTATVAADTPPATQNAADAPPAGASPAFTSNDPTITQARQLYIAGEYTKAEELLKPASTSKDAQVAQAARDLLEIIRRTRMDFTLDEPGLLAKVKRTLPDATADDVHRWFTQGQLHTKTIDGQPRIFNREPQNLFLFCAEAKARKEAVEKKKNEQWTLIDHLSRIVAEAEKTGKTDVAPAKHNVKYTLTIPAKTKGMKAGSVLHVWLPMPQEYRQQRDVKLLSTTPPFTVLAPTAVDGYPIVGAPQRTIYFESTVSDPSKDQVFQANFQYTSYAYYPVLSDDKAQNLPADFPKEYLAERPPHISFSPKARELSAKIVGSETNPLAKARLIFRWCSDNIPWNAEEEYCTIPSISTKGLQTLRGDCGVQSISFQTLCRLAGIPTRWQSGWETKPTGSSMHDWCEIYIAPWGWLPCDPSYGLQKKSADPKVQEFYLGHQDSYRMIFNLDYGRDLIPPKQTLRSEPLDFQRGEVEMDGRNLYFDEWDYNCSWEIDPAGL